MRFAQGQWYADQMHGHGVLAHWAPTEGVLIYEARVALLSLKKGPREQHWGFLWDVLVQLAVLVLVINCSISSLTGVAFSFSQIFIRSMTFAS